MLNFFVLFPGRHIGVGLLIDYLLGVRLLKKYMINLLVGIPLILVALHMVTTKRSNLDLPNDASVSVGEKQGFNYCFYIVKSLQDKNVVPFWARIVLTFLSVAALVRLLQSFQYTFTIYSYLRPFLWAFVVTLVCYKFDNTLPTVIASVIPLFGPSGIAALHRKQPPNNPQNLLLDLRRSIDRFFDDPNVTKIMIDKWHSSQLPEVDMYAWSQLTAEINQLNYNLDSPEYRAHIKTFKNSRDQTAPTFYNSRKLKRNHLYGANVLQIIFNIRKTAAHV